MSKRLFIFLLLIITVINLSATITILYERRAGKRDFSMRARDFDEPFRALRQKLDLKPCQIDSIAKSKAIYWDKMAEPMGNYAELSRQLFAELSSETPREDEIGRLIDEMGQIQTKIRHQTVEQILHEKNFLSPEQHKCLMRMFIDQMSREFERPMFRCLPRGPMHGMGMRGGCPVIDSNANDKK